MRGNSLSKKIVARMCNPKDDCECVIEYFVEHRNLIPTVGTKIACKKKIRI